MDYQDLFFEVLMSTYNQKKNVMELTLSPEAYELLKDLCKDAAEKELDGEKTDCTPIDFGEGGDGF